MSLSREKMLSRIRAALKDRHDADRDWFRKPVDRNYRVKSDMTKEEIIRLFTENVRDYKANVTNTTESELKKVIAGICAEEKVEKLVVPPGINENWLPERESGLIFLRDEPEVLSGSDLDNSDAVLTGCFRAVAQTGTIVLHAGAGQGRRALTLIPDVHICVVFTEQIVGIVPEVFSELKGLFKESRPPLTFVSGPSATSDIELDRVEGVHGPRRLHVLIV